MKPNCFVLLLYSGPKNHNDVKTAFVGTGEPKLYRLHGEAVIS